MAMSKAKQIAFCAVMTALALTLSYAERFLPLQLVIPLPGLKLGLANMVTVTALYLFKPCHAYAILLPRCILGAVFGGGVTALLFSLAGGLLSLTVMTWAKKLPLFSVYGVSILGAAAHQIGQILMAMVLLGSMYVAAYLPWLLLAGMVTGFLMGAACAGVLRPLQTVFASSEVSR